MQQIEQAMRPIAVYDSGVGGISVLGALRQLLPGEDYLYYGDNGHAPYGTKTPEQVTGFAWDAWEILRKQEPKLLLIACNTATSAAAPSLRAKLPIPVVGMEPALKPAHALHRTGAILVLATPMTLALPKFEDLMARYGEGAVPVTCGGLMEFAERGETDSPALHAYLEERLAPWRACEVDAVVLGCTHYLFLRDAIAAHLSPGTPLLDGNRGTAERARYLLREANLLRTPAHQGAVSFDTSGDKERLLPLMERLLAQAMEEEWT